MNPMTEENDFGGNYKLLHQGSGTIPALADEEFMGEDDDYDDLYNDVNVGETFYKSHHQPQAPAQVSASVQVKNGSVAEPRTEVVSGGTVEGNGGINGTETRSDVYSQPQAASKGLSIDVQSNKVVPQGSTSVVLNNNGFQGNAGNVPEMPAPQAAQQIPVSQMSVGLNPVVDKNPAQLFVVDNGNTTLFVGELNWWTTDAEVESVVSQYGRVKEIRFWDERVTGKSKGYCQVEFYDSSAAAACKEGMNGYIFNGKACITAWTSPETLSNQGQNQIQNNRRPLNEGMGRGNNNNNNMNMQNGDGGRNYGRGGFARGGQGMSNRGGPWNGGIRGRGVNNMVNGSGAGPYGPGPAFNGMMNPQGMMAAGGFDPTFMGRGNGYGGFQGFTFPGMPHSYPGVNGMGMVGVAPHVNPAFLGPGIGARMNGAQAAAMWNEAGEEGGSKYEEDENEEKEEKPNVSSRATTERDWSENSGDRRHKSHHREERDSHREYKQHRDRDSEDYYDRGRSSSKSRSRSRMVEDDHRSRSRMAEDNHRSRSRDADYGKRRRGD